MARKMYPKKNQHQEAWTNPPKVYDMKFYSEYVDPDNDAYFDQEKILFSFTMSQPEVDVSSKPSIFHIEILDLATNTAESFVQDYGEPNYRFWQRQAEQDRDTTEFIINSRITVTPINDFGEGNKSTFLLPFKDLVWTRSKENQDIFSVLNTNWEMFSETPEERLNRPKLMFIYLGVPEADIEADREMLSQPEWYFDSLSYSTEINDATYRWSIDDTGHRKLSAAGWTDSTQEEQTFITKLIQTMLPFYRKYLNDYSLTQDSNHIFKVAVENPRDNRDTVIIYMMKGQKWEI